MASMPAMASKFGMPVSKRDGPSSCDGRTLNTGSACSRSGRHHSMPECGAYHLYGEFTRASQPSASMSMRRCGASATASMNTLAPAACAASMMGFRSGAEPSRLLAPGRVTHLVRSSMRSMTSEGSRVPQFGVERGQHVLGAGGLRGAHPGGHVGVVVEAGAHDAVAGLQRGADGPRERERERGHVRAERDAVRVGVEQPPDGRPRAVDQLVGPLAPRRSGRRRTRSSRRTARWSWP